MKSERMKTTMNGALVLTAAALIAKILSAVYRIPFQNIVGNTGFYVYQQIYPIYGIGVTLALNGLPVFISKLIAEEDDPARKQEIITKLLIILTLLGCGMFLFLQTGSGWLAETMGDHRLQPLVSSVSWMFLLIPFLASSRGYYQGIFKMGPTAISQVSEQFVRVVLIIGAAVIGSHLQWSVYKIGSLAMFGSVAGGLTAVFTLAPAFRNFKLTRVFKQKHVSFAKLTKQVFKDGMIICLFSALMVILQLVDSFTVLRGLRHLGMAVDHAKFIKGVYDRGQPLVQLGMTVAFSFSATLLPSLTFAFKKGQKGNYQRVSRSMLHAGISLAIAATAGMISLMPEINLLLFGDSRLTVTISCYVLSVPLISALSIFNAILQSRGHFRGTFFAAIVTIICKILTNSWMIALFDITGAAISTDLSLCVGLAVVVISFPSDLFERKPWDVKFAARLAFCTLLMSLIVWIVMMIVSWFMQITRATACVLVPLGIVVGIVVFVYGAVKVGLLTKKEWKVFPGGRKIVRRM